MKSILLLVICLLLTTSNPQLISAHGGGVSHEEYKDGYFIDIGYQINPIPFEQMRLDFNTYPENDPSAENVFSDVWVRIVQNKELFFSGGIDKPVFGPTGITYAFPKAGTYEIFVRFQKDVDKVVETSFTITVVPNEDEKLPFNLFMAGSIGFILGGVAVFLIFRKKLK